MRLSREPSRREAAPPLPSTEVQVPEAAGRAPAFPWRETYVLHVPVLDQEHRKMFGFLNELHELAFSKAESAQMQSALGRLIDHALHHFASEERLMAAVRYPHRQHHRGEHQHCTRNAVRILERLNAGDTIDPATVTSLKECMVDHILLADRRFAEFYRMRIRTR